MARRCPICGKFMALERDGEYWKDWRCHGINKYGNQCPAGLGEAKYENWPKREKPLSFWEKIKRYINGEM